MRAFLAVELPADLRDRLAHVQGDLKAALAAVTAERVRMTWARPDTIHLTIKFLGDIDEASVGSLEQELREGLRDRTASDLPLDRLGCFPRSREPPPPICSPWCAMWTNALQDLAFRQSRSDGIPI